LPSQFVVIHAAKKRRQLVQVVGPYFPVLFSGWRIAEVRLLARFVVRFFFLVLVLLVVLLLVVVVLLANSALLHSH
jgi:hypothetical protein